MTRTFGGMGPVRQSKARVVLLGSLFVGVMALLLVVALLSSGNKDNAPQPVVIEREAEIKMASVLVPVKEIAAGMPLDPSMFRVDQRPQVGVDSRTVKDFEEIKGGYYARTLILSGQPLLKDLITPIRPTSDVTANIPEGYRAVTIKVDARTSVEGFTRPGAKVDVVWASSIKGQPGVTVIVQNAKVLAAERQTQTDNQNAAPVPNTVTLLVSAADAAKIQLASTTGSLSLQLRGDLDTGAGGRFESITVSDLLGGSSTVSGEDKIVGTVTIGGVKYHVKPGGKMVPAPISAE